MNSKISGLSLIELLITLAISSILTIGIVNMYSASKNSFYVQEDSSKIQESGRFVFNMLIADLRRAGYYGYNSDLSKITGTAVKINNTNTCPNDTTWARMLDQPILGLDQPAVGYNCIANYLTGDILALHYVDGRNEIALDNNRFYIRSSFKKAKMFLGADLNDPQNVIDDVTPKITGRLQAFAYYVGTSARVCRFNDANNNPINIPTLYRESLDENGLPERQEVASGIENIQFQYGIDSDNDQSVNQYFDAQAISNNPAVSPNWNEVVSVRFWVLARANCPANIDANQQTSFTMGDVTVARNDRFKRKLFTSTVALRN